MPIAGGVIEFEIPWSHVWQIDADRVDSVVLRIDEEVFTIASQGHSRKMKIPFPHLMI